MDTEKDMQRMLSFNSRDNILLDVLDSTYKCDFVLFEKKFFQTLQKLVEDLKIVGIDYYSLKSVLCPSKDNKEIVMCFDSSITTMYGNHYLAPLFALLSQYKKSSFIIKHGDILYKETMDFLPINAHQCLKTYKPFDGIYCIYVSNLTENQKKRLLDFFGKFDGFLDSIDCTFNSPFKSIMSITLPQFAICHKGRLIIPNADIEGAEESDFEYFDKEILKTYGCENLQKEVRVFDIYYYMFLESKISKMPKAWQRDDKKDNGRIAKILTGRKIDLDNMIIELTDGKIEYLRNEKKLIKRLGWEAKKRAEIEEAIREELNNNMIFDIRIKPECNALLFNVMIEKDFNKYLFGFEYIPDKNIFKVATGF